MARPSSADRARRMIALLNRFRNAEGQRIPFSVLAEELGVSAKEIEKDLLMLSMCAADPTDAGTAVPIFVEDDYVEVWRDMPVLRGGVRLSAREARAVAAALEAAGFDADDPVVRRLSAAYANASDPAEVGRILRSETTAHHGAHYKQLADASARRRVVVIEYLRGGTTEVESRAIEPDQLFSERGVWYVHAYCRNARGYRTFRLDRIRTLRATDERFEPHQLADTPARAFDHSDLPQARLEFAEEGGYVHREWPGSTIVSREAGRLQIELPYSGTSWIARQVIARLGEVVVLEPAEVREAVVSLARAEALRFAAAAKE